MKKYFIFSLSLFLLLANACEAVNIAYVRDTGKQQSDGFTGSTGTTGSFGTLPAIGNHVIISVSGFRTGGFLLSTPTDNQGNTYNKDASVRDAGPNSEASISSTRVAFSSGTYTITLKATGNSNTATWIATEYSGIVSRGWLDATGTAQVTSTTGGTVTATNPGRFKGDLVVAAVATDSGDAAIGFSAPSGGSGSWTESYVENNGSAHSAGESGYKIASLLETSAATWTWSESSGVKSALVLATYMAQQPSPVNVRGGVKIKGKVIVR